MHLIQWEPQRQFSVLWDGFYQRDSTTAVKDGVMKLNRCLVEFKMEAEGFKDSVYLRFFHKNPRNLGDFPSHCSNIIIGQLIPEPGYWSDQFPQTRTLSDIPK